MARCAAAPPRLCNVIDDTGVGGIDEGVTVALCVDADHDGYGTGAAVQGCPGRPGYSLLSNDCDDTNAAIQPGAVVCVSAISPANHQVCQGDGTYLGGKCSGQAICHAQPNGTGICL